MTFMQAADGAWVGQHAAHGMDDWTDKEGPFATTAGPKGSLLPGMHGREWKEGQHPILTCFMVTSELQWDGVTPGPHDVGGLREKSL